jgi:hypothetical protein
LFRDWTRIGQQLALSGLSLSLAIGLDRAPALADKSSNPTPVPAVALGAACPSTLPALIDRMLPDLPSYINRVRIGAGITKSYILLAAKPDLEPLPLSLPTMLPSPVQASEVKQVFFTTLMRRYDGGRIANLQEYHWVFLSQQPPNLTPDWQFVMMYSTLGVYPATAEHPPLPPRNSSDGSVAQAIKTWLKDCRSGNLQPIRPPLGPIELKLKKG